MHLRISVALPAILVAASLGAGCGGPQQSPPAASAPKAALPPASPAPAPVPPPQSDIRSELLGTLVAGSLDSLLDRISGYLAPALPAAVQPMLQPDALRTELFKQLHLDGLAPALDSSRPVAAAAADPIAYRQGLLGSMIVALPLKDASAFLDGLGRVARLNADATKPWGDRLYDLNGSPLLCRVDRGDWAFLASHEKLLHGARGALLPLVDQGAPGTLRVTVDMNAIQARYGAQLDRLAAGGIPNVAPLPARWAGRLVSHLKGTRALELQLTLRPDTIEAQLRAHALAQGAFRQYLDELPAGEPWGAKYLPADSAVVLLDRTRPETFLQWFDELALAGKVALGEQVDEPTVRKLREAAAASTFGFGAESAWGLWATSDGGLGLGGATALTKDAATTQRQLARTTKRLLGPLLRKLTPEGKPTLSVAIRPLPVAGLKADRYELSIGWPRPKDQDARRRLEEAKKTVGKLFGPKPSFAFVATSGVGLLALGKDHRKRLADMVAIAKGGPATSNEKLCRELAGRKGVAMLLHSSLVSVVESVMRVAEQLTRVPDKLREGVNQLLPGPGKTMPATAMAHKDKDSLFWELSVSSDILVSLSKAFFFVRPSAAP